MTDPIAARKKTRIHYVAFLLMAGLWSLLVQFILDSSLSGSALIYVGMPYLLALLIAALRPYHPKTKWYQKYTKFVANTIVIFLASALILREGFLCVIVIVPILLIGVTLAFLTEYFRRLPNHRSNHFSLIIPLVMVLASLEGTTQTLSFDRDESVSVVLNSNVHPSTLHQNLTLPMDLQQDRNWLLQLFPMPYEIDSPEFEIGAVHIAKTRYHRWFVTNTHEGELQLEITKLTDHSLATRIIEDTSYFSSYLTLKGTKIDLLPLADGGTQINLTIHYRRDLDPAWYFAPIQRYAIHHMAHLIIQEVIIRDSQTKVRQPTYRS